MKDRRIFLVETVNKRILETIDEIPGIGDHVLIDATDREYEVKCIVRNYRNNDIKVMIQPLNPNNVVCYGV